MVDLTMLNRWNVDLAKAIEAMGSEAFFRLVFDALRNQVKIAYPQVWLYRKGLPPQLLAEDIPKHAHGEQIDDYVTGAYLDDPMYQTAINNPRSHIYRLSRVTAGKLEESDYFKNYYRFTGTVDEVSFVTRLADGSVVCFSLMRLERQGEFTNEEYDLLYALAETVAATIQSHCHRDDFAVQNLLQPGLDHQIDTAFKSFGSTYVSSREQQVLEMMLRGYSTQASADRLHISLETVRRHRKSIYKKLDVSSQTDLFALFINAMPYLGSAQGGDPLAVYMA